jgi:ATP-dependent Zn protease
VTAAVALLACVCAIVHATSALAAMPLPRESLVTFEGQLNRHQVSAVTLHTKVHTFHASLTDGHRVSIAFPSSQQQRLEGDIRARGIAVQVAKVQSPPSHKRRYIVGAVVIVVVVLAIVGLLLLSARRRRMHEDEQGPGYR